MTVEVKIYRDTGADITFLKPYLSLVNIYQYPYDSIHRPKNQKMELSVPSELPWNHANATWGEHNVAWENCSKSVIYDAVVRLIGRSNDADILHIDSAYKEGCHIFLTSDKVNIWSNRLELERMCKFRIFFHKDEQQVIEYLDELLKVAVF